jgi:glycosyltransferase involved in cell wall biosynthesis
VIWPAWLVTLHLLLRPALTFWQKHADLIHRPGDQFQDPPLSRIQMLLWLRRFMKIRVAFVFTHRIQYFTNILDELSVRGNIVPIAIYAHETAKIDDLGFGRRIVWDNRPNVTFTEILLQDSSSRSHGSFWKSFSRELFSTLSRLKVQVVHLNGYSHALQWQAWAWAITHRIPILLRGDGDTFLCPPRRRAFYKRKAARFFTKRASHVFYQGEENRKFWLRNGASPEKMSWIPCVSDARIFSRKAFPHAIDREAFRSKNGVAEGEVVFLVSGKLEGRKRPQDAIHALARLPGLAARVWYLGSGSLEKELRELAHRNGVSERITWWGFRNQSEMPPILQAADVLLHLSESDPWPYSVLEGAVSGLTLLLSDKVGSYPDWISAAGAGQIFRCGDIDNIAQAMRYVAKHRDKRLEFKSSARRGAEKNTEAEFCECFEKVVESLSGAMKRVLK